jgi:hypothetical protein
MMNAPHRSADGRSPLDILVKQAPVVTGMLALGVGLATAGDANAALVVTDINVTLPQDGNFNFLDINLNGDATIDFRLQTSSSDLIQIQDRTTTKNPFISVVDFTDLYPSMLGAGDTVDANWFNGTNGFGNSFGNLVDSSGNGPWSAIGAHGFIGLKLDLGEGIHYGWLEVTRGSAIVGQMGYQTTANAGASIVPLPASLPLLASGFAGLMALRHRRRKATDETLHQAAV